MSHQTYPCHQPLHNYTRNNVCDREENKQGKRTEDKTERLVYDADRINISPWIYLIRKMYSCSV